MRRIIALLLIVSVTIPVLAACGFICLKWVKLAGTREKAMVSVFGVTSPAAVTEIKPLGTPSLLTPLPCTLGDRVFPGRADWDAYWKGKKVVGLPEMDFSQASAVLVAPVRSAYVDFIGFHSGGPKPRAAYRFLRTPIEITPAVSTCSGMVAAIPRVGAEGELVRGDESVDIYWTGIIFAPAWRLARLLGLKSAFPAELL